MSDYSVHPRVVLDCIIFGLQKQGGVSNYWYKLLESYLKSSPELYSLLLPRVIKFEGYQKELFSRFSVRNEFLPASISRYFPCAEFGLGDVFHTSYYRLPTWKPKRYVVTAYDFIYERYRKGSARWIHSLQKRRSLERADVIPCISKFTRDDVLQFFPQIDPSRLHIVPLGVDTDTFYPDPQEMDKWLKNTVLFVGQRNGYKRFDLAVNAMRVIERQFILGIVGPQLSADEQELLNRVLAGRWQYFGAVSSNRLRQLYSSVYALLFPSECEGFGLPMLEAMACNCPVVAARRASLPEVGGDAALYAQDQHPDDYSEILKILTDDSLRSMLVDAGASRAKQFSWMETCRMTRELYKN